MSVYIGIENSLISSIKDTLYDRSGHGLDHVLRVRTLALLFADSEGADAVFGGERPSTGRVDGYNYDFDLDATEDFNEWGLGVQYTYNPNVKFGLNYVKIDWDNSDDDDVIRFRTQVTIIFQKNL